MINNIALFNPTFNTNSTDLSNTSKIDEIITAHKKDISVNEKEINNNDSNLYLSTRAQKINSLSNEFFNRGGMNFDDIDLLKERAYQLGLLSKEEYAHLTHTELSEEELKASQDLSSQNIANFIGSFLERLDETDINEDANVSGTESNEENQTLTTLKNTLLRAKEILADIEEAKKDPKFKESLMDSISSLKEIINTNAFNILPIDDKVGLSKAYQSLEIVNKISPMRLSNAKLNLYMQVAFK